MRNLVIIGARSFGREIFHFATICKGYNSDFCIKGYLDDDVHVLDSFNAYPPILNSVENYEVLPDDCFICALGDPLYKKKYIDIIEQKNGYFYSLIHSSVIIYDSAVVGRGVIICPYSVISCNVSIGDHVTIHPFADIGHDASVGKYSVIGSHTRISGFSEIGVACAVHTGSQVLPHKKVGNNAVVGAGSIVIKNVKEGVTVFGNPATKI